MLVNVYVDGFNLYYGAVRGQPYKWLDLEKFAREMLRASDTIGRICYCTALVDSSDDWQAQMRQRSYIRALQTIPCLDVAWGEFKTTYPYMVPAGGGPSVQVRKRSEKGSDVNLASNLLLDAMNRKFEMALVITNDSDLVTPIEMVVRHCGLKVGVAMPILNKNQDGSDREPSVRLQQVASFTRYIRDTRQWRARLARSQFPSVVNDGNGAIRKPLRWWHSPY